MRLVIVGAGAFGKTVKDVAAQSNKYDSIFFLDDSAQNDTAGDIAADNSVKDDTIEIAGKVSDFENFISDDTEFLVAFGNNELRYNTIEAIAKAGGNVGELIHPTAYVSPTATVGAGSIILPNASVGTDVVLEDGCIINMGAIVDHGVLLGAGVHVAPGAIVKGENAILAFTKVESGEVIQRGQFPVA